MEWFENKKKPFAFMFLGLFTLTGTYNAVVINSESHITGEDIKFVKRLDELYGVTTPARVVANSMKWQKLPKQQIATAQPSPTFISQSIQRQEAAPAQAAGPQEEQVVATSAIQEDLNLSLVEVINPKKWQQGLNTSQFSGSLSTSNGSIDELSVGLPDGDGVSISFTELTGNVFEYDYNGELYSGMLYQVDQNSYMVSLTNGPLEGTRLRFSNTTLNENLQQSQQNLAEQNIEAGSFGNSEPSPEMVVQTDRAMQEEAEKAQQVEAGNQPEAM